MKRLPVYLAMGAAALAVAVASPDTAYSWHGSQTTTKFCFKFDPNHAGNSGWTKRDNWLKTKVLIKQCNYGCAFNQVEEVHTENGGSYRTSYKCGPQRTYTAPNFWSGQMKAISGKIDLKWGPDITFDGHGPGPFCFTAKRVKGNHVNPWTIEESSGC